MAWFRSPEETWYHDDMHTNVTLTAADRKLVYALFEQVNHMITEVKDNHPGGDRQGAALEAVMRLQLYLEQKRKELALEVI